MKTLERQFGKLKQLEERVIVELSGQDMINMGWDISDDSPEDDYELYIDNNEISASILCSNGEYNDSGFTFEYIETIEDLQQYGKIKLVEVESGVFEIQN